MFIYLSRWNLFATMIATVMGAILVTRSNLNGTTSRTLKFYWFLCNNSACFACVISCIYWKMLYEDGESSLDKTVNNFLVHATNSLVLIFDLFIVAHPFKMSHCAYTMLCGAFYMLFTIVYTFLGGVDRSGGNFVYPILDWRQKPEMSTVVGIGCILALGTVHMIIGGIHRTRNEVHRCLRSKKIKNNEQTLPFVHKNSNKTGNKL